MTEEIPVDKLCSHMKAVIDSPLIEDLVVTYSLIKYVANLLYRASSDTILNIV
jgi:hypothetical protein